MYNRSSTTSATIWCLKENRSKECTTDLESGLPTNIIVSQKNDPKVNLHLANKDSEMLLG